MEKKKEKVIKPSVKKAALDIKRGLYTPVTYQEHLDVGFVTIQQSEKLQGAGKVVIEIKNVEGKLLHKLKE